MLLSSAYCNTVGELQSIATAAAAQRTKNVDVHSQLEHVAEDCTTALRECDALVDELREMREFQQSEIVSAESLQSYVGRPEGIFHCEKCNFAADTSLNLLIAVVIC